MPVYDENGNIVEVEEPDWGLLMFWEDLTHVIMTIWSFIKALFS